MIMKELDCIGFFVQMFYSSITSVQRSAVSILAELSTNKECAEVIEQQAGLHQFVQANFCNQYGLLKTIAEISQDKSGNHASIILQHVTTLMQRLQEHRNQRAYFQQQQQQQQRFGQDQFYGQQQQFNF